MSCHVCKFLRGLWFADDCLIGWTSRWREEGAQGWKVCVVLEWLQKHLPLGKRLIWRQEPAGCVVMKCRLFNIILFHLRFCKCGIITTRSKAKTLSQPSLLWKVCDYCNICFQFFNSRRCQFKWVWGPLQHYTTDTPAARPKIVCLCICHTCIKLLTLPVWGGMWTCPELVCVFVESVGRIGAGDFL